MKLKILGFLVYILVCIPIIQGGKNYDFSLIFVNLIIAAISVYSLFAKKQPFSLYKIFHIFILFFFCIAPILQYKDGIYMWGTIFTEEDYMEASLFTLFIVIFFNILYGFLYKRTRIKISSKSITPPKVIGTKKEWLLIAMSLFVCYCFLYINKFSITSLMFRGGEYVDRIDIGSTALLVINNFLRPMPMIIFLAAYIVKTRHKIVLPILFILMLISAPPTGMARFHVAAMYIPVFLCMFPVFQKGNRFTLLIIFGLLVIFPMLNMFRYGLIDGEIKLELNFDQFKDLNFDSYSMFMRVLKDDIVTFGRQLLGVLFFFVPRTMWPAKPIGSGAMIGEEMGFTMTNVSMPYFGEGYINFGVMGVILFVGFMAYILARYDKRYWSVDVYNKKSINVISYMMLFGLLLFMLRGDLMSSFAFMCGYICSFLFVKKVLL